MSGTASQQERIPPFTAMTYSSVREVVRVRVLAREAVVGIAWRN
jgi:hypothetical protein